MSREWTAYTLGELEAGQVYNVWMTSTSASGASSEHWTKVIRKEVIFSGECLLH